MYDSTIGEALTLSGGGTVDELSWGVQQLRLYQVKKAALAMAIGERVVTDVMTAQVMAKQTLTLRRRGSEFKKVGSCSTIALWNRH